MTVPSYPNDAVPSAREIARRLDDGEGRQVDMRIAEAVRTTMISMRDRSRNRACKTCTHMVVNDICGNLCSHPLVAPPLYDNVRHYDVRPRIYCEDARAVGSEKKNEAPGLCGPEGILHHKVRLPVLLHLRGVVRAFRRGLRTV